MLLYYKELVNLLKLLCISDGELHIGFINMHTQGGAGHEFFGSAEDIVQVANFHLSYGITPGRDRNGLPP